MRTNGVDTTHEFDALSRLTELDHDGPLGSLEARTFGYDALERRTSEVGPEGTHAFEYDPLSQLVETIRPAGYPFPGFTFGLDQNGNRTSAGGTSYISNSLDQYQSVGGTAFAYDLAGNLTSDGVRTFGYDEENRLTTASGPALTATYGYDALGRRIRKTVNGTETLYVHDGEQILQELDAAEVVQAVYRYGFDLDQPLTMRRNNVPSWYLTDPIGTVTAIADAAGNVVERYRYDAFGEVAIFDGAGAPLTASAVGNSFLFTGRELDPETGLYHYRARAYSPQLGRFLQRDPLGQGPDVNVYRYVGNHPLDATDAFGLDWLSNTSNFFAGWGDLITFGLTNQFREVYGYNNVVDKCSGAYSFGEGVGIGHAALTGGLYGLRGAQFAVPKVTNPGLQDAVKNLFRPGGKIPGGTAGAIIVELLTLTPVGGTGGHITKGFDRMQQLRNILAGRKGPLSAADRRAAMEMLEDLDHALSGKGLTVRQQLNRIVGFAQGAALGASLGFASKAYRDDFWDAVENVLR